MLLKREKNQVKLCRDDQSQDLLNKYCILAIVEQTKMENFQHFSNMRAVDLVISQIIYYKKCFYIFIFV